MYKTTMFSTLIEIEKKEEEEECFSHILYQSKNACTEFKLKEIKAVCFFLQIFFPLLQKSYNYSHQKLLNLNVNKVHVLASLLAHPGKM